MHARRLVGERVRGDRVFSDGARGDRTIAVGGAVDIVARWTLAQPRRPM
jgi:hypothetical protein